jgi:hypothetical protein
MGPADVDWDFGVKTVEVAKVHKEEPPKYFTDSKQAVFLAALMRRPLVIWVDCKVNDHKDFYNKLDDAVHLEMTRQERGGGIPGGHVVVKGGDDCEYAIQEGNLDDKSVNKVRQVWGLPYDGPALTRPGIAVQEELGNKGDE